MSLSLGQTGIRIGLQSRWKSVLLRSVGMRERKEPKVTGETFLIIVLFNAPPYPSTSLMADLKTIMCRRVQEMQTALQRTFAEAILTNLHPRSEILITLHILSQDGSVLATCINACTLALIDAGIPMSDYVVACTAGSHSVRSGTNFEVEGEDPLLDMNNIEESDLPGVTIATIGNSEKITLLQLETKVRLERLEGMMAVALDGCGKLKEVMDDIVRTYGNEMARRGAL